MVNRDLRTCGPVALELIVARGRRPRLPPAAAARDSRPRPPPATPARGRRPLLPPATIWTSLPEAGIGLDQGGSGWVCEPAWLLDGPESERGSTGFCVLDRLTTRRGAANR